MIYLHFLKRHICKPVNEQAIFILFIMSRSHIDLSTDFELQYNMRPVMTSAKMCTHSFKLSSDLCELLHGQSTTMQCLGQCGLVILPVHMFVQQSYYNLVQASVMEWMDTRQEQKRQEMLNQVT